MNVLVFAAHPDDELLGLGGTLARHADSGDSVTAVIVADGATSRYDAGAETELQRSCHAAAEVLGISDVRFLGLPDQRLDTFAILEISQKLEALVAEQNPDIVYAHHWGDLNRDHRVVAEAALTACRPVAKNRPDKLYFFETPSASEWAYPADRDQFIPTRFVDISATLERKLAAMAKYESELRPPPHPRSLEALRSRAHYWGQTASMGAAEAFVVGRELV